MRRRAKHFELCGCVGLLAGLHVLPLAARTTYARKYFPARPHLQGSGPVPLPTAAPPPTTPKPAFAVGTAAGAQMPKSFAEALGALTEKQGKGKAPGEIKSLNLDSSCRAARVEASAEL